MIDPLVWSRMGAQEECEEPAEVAELATKLCEPLYPGARVTLLQVCWVMLTLSEAN